MEALLTRKRIFLLSRIRIALILILSLLVMEPVSGQDRYAAARGRIVQQQLSGRGIKDKATLSAMQKVRRHLFVPADQMNYAYDDRPLPIGYGQTISQPYMVAYMTEAIRPAKA